MAGSKLLYKVTNIDFWDLAIEARETDLDVSDVPEEEVFNIEQFKDFRIKLLNGSAVDKIIDFVEWKRRHKSSTDYCNG